MNEVKRYLMRPTEIYGNIVLTQEKMENLRLNMLPRGICYDRDKVQTSPSDPMPDFGAKIDELNRELVELANEFDKALDEVQDVIRQVNNDEAKTILAKRYIGKKPWRVIAMDVCSYMSEETMYRRHRLGLRAVEKILRENKKLTVSDSK